MIKVIHDAGNKLKVEQIYAFEKRLGFKLADDYKQFLQKYNGGRPEPCVFDFCGVDGKKNESLIARFYSVDCGGENDLEKTYLFYKNSERIPADILPIACDPFGNMICISLSNNDKDFVYFWDHELELDFSEYENLASITKDFSSFLSILHY